MTPPPEPPDFPASQLFLRRLAYHLVRDEARAEDLVQETWAAWIEHKPSGLVEPRAWLARVLRNRAFNQKRADERRTLREGLAGRPDVSAPETDGTLEAQAQLVEALRKLEEPFRSALVQRYYHDLPPAAIAERSGAPLNTVKARLARGLEKLRAEMDRRYRGDRKAWCHWLTVLGAPPLVTPLPGGPAAGTGAGASGGSSAGSSALAWTGVALLVGTVTVVRALWHEPRGPGRTPSSGTSGLEPGDTERTLQTPGASRAEPREEREVAEAPARVDVAPSPLPRPVAPEPAARTSSPPSSSAPFDWPQYAGGPEHDTWRERQDAIEVPRVLWFQPGLAGVPSLRNGDLYSGGLVLARLDPDSGEVRSATSPLSPVIGALFALLMAGGPDAAEPDAAKMLQIISKAGAEPADVQKELEEFARRMQDIGDPDSLSVAGAPVLTPRSVIVRDLDDGSVRAYDRDLSEELWRYEVDESREERPEHARVPLCLAKDGTLLVVAGSRLVALRSTDGYELWDFSCNGRIRMAPACDGVRVFFGIDKGLFFGLSLDNGKKLWQASGGTFSSTPPVVVDLRVFVSDQGPMPWQTSDNGTGPSDPTASAFLHGFKTRNGFGAWKLGFNGARMSPLGLFEKGRRAFAAFGEEIVEIDMGAGRIPSAARNQTPAAVRGTPAVVGESLVFACDDALYVHELEKLRRRWAFRVPKGAEIEDFVHTGERIYLATSVGLFCLGNDPEAKPIEPGFVLTWDGEAGSPLLDLGR